MLAVDSDISAAPVLAALHARCFDSPWSEAEFRALLTLPTTVTWITDKAFLMCSKIADEMEILTLGVLPEYRRQHLARNLLDQMITYADRAKIHRIFLEVSVQNIPAQALYRKQGFYQVGLRPGYYRTPEGPTDALCFRLDLPAGPEETT